MQSQDQNVIDYLDKAALERPNQKSVFEPTVKTKSGQYCFRSYTNEQLQSDSDRLASGLLKLKIEPGSRVALMIPPSFSFFSLVFALFKVGAIPILIDPGMGVKNLKQCLKEAAPDAFAGTLKAHIARVLFGWEKGKLKNKIIVGKKNIFFGKNLEDIRKIADQPKSSSLPKIDSENTAAIVFTSGSTGSPKGAVYTHRNFNALINILRDSFQVKKGEIDLCTFPLFGLIAPALEMVSIIPVMDFTRPARVNTDHIFKVITQFQVTNLFGSPALIRRISRAGISQKIKLPTLKRAFSAGAPVPLKTIRDFDSLLNKDAQIYTPYGATEALPITSIGSKELLNLASGSFKDQIGICVGSPLDRTDIVIIKIIDDPIKIWDHKLITDDGEIGEITVSGQQVTQHYINRLDAELIHKIKDPLTNLFYHRMGDLGYKDSLGRIWFCGRKSHRVITKDKTLFTIPIENVFNQHPEVYRSALVGIPDGNYKKPVIIIEPEKQLNKNKQAKLRESLREFAKEQLADYQIDKILFYYNFPVDIRHNAKINRDKLAVWAEKKKL